MDAANAAISAASVTSGVGIFLRGRQLTILRALDKKSAHQKELDKAKTEDHDHRNLYLAKVDSSNNCPSPQSWCAHVLTCSCVNMLMHPIFKKLG